MTFLRRTALACGALLATATLAAACSSDDADPKQCDVRAAFDLTVRAVPGPLPPDTLLEVEYGGGIETYRVDTGDAGQEVVLCKQDGPEGGDAGSGVTAVHCQLWTQSVTHVTVTATGYPTVKQELEAKAQGKCIQTVPVEIVLGDQDAAL